MTIFSSKKWLYKSANDDLHAAERLLSLARRFNAGKSAIVSQSRGATVEQQIFFVLEITNSIVAPRLVDLDVAVPGVKTPG